MHTKVFAVFFLFHSHKCIACCFRQDVFGDGANAKGGTKMSSTKYFRFNPLIGKPDSFPIDEVDPDRLQELCDIVDRYMGEGEQKSKLKQLGDIIHPK